MMKIIQRLGGSQARPYADHVWCWDIITDKPEEEVLKYCREHFESAGLEKSEYFRKYREQMSFDELMGIVVHGYYYLTKIEGGYQYSVVKEYID